MIRILIFFLLIFKVSYSQTDIDETIRLLKANKELPFESIRALNIVDTSNFQPSEGNVYCDSTIQLTKDTFYSIISISDTLALCSYYFVVCINEKNKKAIASKYLYSACDIDYSSENYELYDHKVISNDSIQIRQTIVYQKKNRTSNNEEENIERKETRNYFVTVKRNGEIISNKK